MQKRVIEKTQEEISPLGFGAMRLQSKNGKINREIAKKQIYYGIDNGINFIDTAAVYGNGDNERFLGEILQGEYRNKVKLSTKLPVPLIKKNEDMEKILNNQLERLKTDYIDYYFLHNIDLKTLKKLIKKDVFSFLEKAKNQNKIKYIGFSYHGKKEEFKEVVDLYDWDMIMVQYNYLDDNIQASSEGIKYASNKGIGIFVMEPLKGGILAGKIPKECEKIFKNTNETKSTAEWGLSWVLNQKEVTCVLSGMNEIEQIKENIAISKKVFPNSLTKNELDTIERVKNLMKKMLKINCTTCGYCMPCPQGVNIPECIKIYNEKYLFNQKGLISQSLINYYMIAGGVMTNSAEAGLCNNCKKCVRKCPQELNIPEELNKVKKEFEGYGFKYKVKFIEKIGLPLYQRFS